MTMEAARQAVFREVRRSEKGRVQWARDAGLDPATLRSFLNGERATSEQNLRKIEQGLGWDDGVLFDLIDAAEAGEDDDLSPPSAGQVLRARREQAKLTVEGAAALANMSPSEWRAMEAAQSPGLIEMSMAAKALDLDAASLLQSAGLEITPGAFVTLPERVRKSRYWADGLSVEELSRMAERATREAHMYVSELNKRLQNVPRLEAVPADYDAAASTGVPRQAQIDAAEPDPNVDPEGPEEGA